MKSRERVLLLGVLVLAVLVGLFVFLPLYLKKLGEARERLTKAEKEHAIKMALLDKETKEAKRIKDVSPRLEQWKKNSLPEPTIDPVTKAPRDPKAHLDRLQIEYTNFLNEQLRRSGFQGDRTTVTAGKFDDRQTPQYAKNKPIYGIIPFTIEGSAPMAGIIKLLEGLHKAPLLHQVKSFSLRRPRTLTRGQRADDIDVKLTVEVLQMVGAERRDALMPTFSDKQPAPVVLATKPRKYEEMAGKNLFGLNPPPPEPVKPTGPTTPTVQSKPKEKLEDVLPFVRLTGVDYSEGLTAFDDKGSPYLRDPAWEATLLNLSRPTLFDEAGQQKWDVSRFKMNARGRMRPGWEEFTILDKYGNEVVKGQVMRIEPRALVMLIDRKFYRLKLGFSLQEAMVKVLEESEVKEMGFELPKEPEKSPDKDTKSVEKKPEEKQPEEKKN